MFKRSFFALLVLAALSMPALAEQPRRSREREVPIFERVVQILKKLGVVSLSPGLTEPKP